MHVPPRIYRRVPFKTAVRLEFDRFRGFIEEYSANLSLGGMFIRTDTPPPMGTVLPIEFRLGNDYELIKGTGRVVWVREEGLDEENPAGIGIRFLELTPGSRELIFRMVERRVRDGGVPFDVEQPADLLPGRPPEPGPAPEGEIAAGGDDEDDDDMPVLAPLPPAAAPSERPPVRPPAERPPTRPPAEQPPTRPPAAPPAAPAADTRDAPRPLLDPPRSTSLPPNLSPFTVEEHEAPTRHETPKPSYFRLPGEGVPDDEPATPEPERAPPPAAPPPAVPPSARPPVRPLASSPAEHEPLFSFEDLEEDDDTSVPPPHTFTEPDPADEPSVTHEPEELVETEETHEPNAGAAWEAAREPAEPTAPPPSTAAAVAAADRTPPPAAAELFAAAESGVGLAPPPVEPADPPTVAPSPYASTAYRPPTEAGAGVAADAGERPAWRRWVLFGVPLLIALVAGAWVVQDRFLAGDETADATPAAEAGDGETAPWAAADEAVEPVETGGGEAPAGRASGLDIGDVVPDADADAEPDAPDAGEAAATDTDEEDPFGPVTMPDGAPAPGAPGTISEITWSAEGRSTVFLIWTGGPIDQGSVRDFRLDGGNPRHVVRLLGIDQPYTRSEATVGTRQVRRLRTGLHVDREPPELHVVFDLNADTEVVEIQARGNQVRIVVTGGAR